MTFFGLEFGTLLQCILAILSTIVMALASKNALFNIEKLEGTNFSYWKEHFYNALVQNKQVKHIKCKWIKPKHFDDDDEWQELDELVCSTIMLVLSKLV